MIAVNERRGHIRAALLFAPRQYRLHACPETRARVRCHLGAWKPYAKLALAHTS
jgi:hypothetical protein